MRHRNVLKLIGMAAALMPLAARPAAAQIQMFSPADWLMHRGNPMRQGGNGDPGLAPMNTQNALVPTWVYPGTRDMPAEIVVDNTVLPVPAVPFPAPVAGYPANDQSFAVGPAAGSWTYPALNNRAGGAWPPSDADFNKLGDYIYTPAVQSTVLKDIGTPTLASLPDLGAQGYANYKQVQDDLNETLPANANMAYARWSFGTKYPYGTYQGTQQVSYITTNPAPAVPVDPTDYHQQALAPNQRYAVYIRFPSSGTLDVAGTTSLPNVNHALVRVSWGADVNDPVTSRIFMVEPGQTGGSWIRIRRRSSPSDNDDRYFPYDGVNPIRVTIYSKTPDDPNDQNEFGVPPNVPADSVRLVPEALRGDIHASAASAKFPLTNPTGAGTQQLTYFGRDETTGPSLISNLNNVTGPSGNFATTPWDPTKPTQNNKALADYNPLIDDPTQSIRSAVFYCMQDDLAGNRFGALRWRYVARSAPVSSVVVDDQDGPPTYTENDPLQFSTLVGGQSYNNGWQASTVNNAITATATWQQGLSTSLPQSTTWSVYVWIPAGTTENFAQHATYTINTDQGPVTYTLDQRNTDPTNMTAVRTGMWRQLAGGIRFPSATFNGTAYTSVGSVTLTNQSPRDVLEDPTRVVAFDAVQFVAESQNTNRVNAAPLIANVLFPDGVERKVVYFATTDGHVWALDAFGTAAANQPFTTTTAYWVYPSISNPAVPAGYTPVRDDPNYNADQFNNKPSVGIDGDAVKTNVNGTDVFTAVRTAPDLGAWNSSPMMIRVQTSVDPAPKTYQQYLVIANSNGRVYAFDPVGRVDPLTNAPYAVTLANGNTPGIPGTTRRLMTWPSVQRDKWLRKTIDVTQFSQYTDDPAKGLFSASFSADTRAPGAGEPEDIATRIIGGANDGHVYAVDMHYGTVGGLDPRVRISRSDPNNSTADGQPLWMYPASNTQVDAISQPGALSSDFARYVFTAGGRVYSIDTAAPLGAGGAAGTASLRWVYPFTSQPPGTPNPPNDLPAEQIEFTAPALRTLSNFNGGNEAVFIANKDGRIFALDNSVVGPNGTPVVRWTSLSQGGTRASVTFINQLRRQDPYTTRDVDGPRILLPLDTGQIIAVDIISGGGPGGGIVWAYYDALIGAVPLNALAFDNNGNLTSQLSFFATSNAYRGADAITANQWVYEGDEGNQDTGEMNGQFRAYAALSFGGMLTPGEPTITPTTGGVELRMVDLWNSRRDGVAPALAVWDDFGLPPIGNAPPQPDPNAKSPYIERVANHQKLNATVNGTQTRVVVYEWGDTIYMAAWGIYSGNILPQVTFTISGPSNKQIPAIVTPDFAYARDGGPMPLTTFVPGGVGEQPARPFVAKAQYSLSRGTDDFPQTPGQQYRISAFAQLNGNGTFARTPVLYAGQFDPITTNPNPPPTLLPPRDPNNLNPPTNNGGGVGPPRDVAIAHPFAMTTRGAATGNNLPNIVGWTDNIAADNSNTDFSEVMLNGNARSTLQGNAFVETTLKDLVAPLGFVTHGSSASYSTVNNTGATGPGLLIADRSNLWKNNQRLSGVRVERTDLHWGWDRTTADAFKQRTGNVMNPLPWETFPNTVPNVSPDYPDVNREHTKFNFGDQNMATRGITLLPPKVAGGIKTLVPTTIDLIVDTPKYQPANINGHYFDLNGNQLTRLLWPMNRDTGQTAATANPQTTAPSAGYVGSYAVYVDSNNDGVFQGFAPGVSQGQRTVLQARQEVFRELNVGIGVPPDVSLRTEEETVDVGTVPHSEGYSPQFPFQPSFFGSFSEWGPKASGAPYSVWDKTFALFKPFTVRNQGNVNLVNLRTAKIWGNASNPSFSPANPLFWFFFGSDQVQGLPYTYNNYPLAAVGFYPNGNPFSAPPGQGTGNIGIVSSLDHVNTAKTNLWETDLWSLPGIGLPNTLPVDYVQNGNVLNWAAYSRRNPTVGKPRPGDVAPRTLSIPDTYYGDPAGELAALKAYDTAKYGAGNERSFRPQISVAIPLGTPAGTYTLPVNVFEDHIPEQWRGWLQNGDPDGATAGPTDDDGILTMRVNNADTVNVIPEAKANPFNLKVTVAEARLTNGSSPASFVQVDNRSLSPNNNSMGANIQPVALRDAKSGKLVLYWPSNRVLQNNVWQDPGTPDAPWYLFSTQLNPAGTLQQSLNTGFFDWMYEPNARAAWWNPMAAAAKYPAAAAPNNLFPSVPADILGNAPTGTPLVPGAINAQSIRHATPALAQDDDTTNNGLTWLFWQGSATKSASNNAPQVASFVQDTRTFYVPLNPDGTVPDPTATPPFSFLNDPNLPKFAPKPVIVNLNGGKLGFLFWYGGEQGRTKLYYNSNVQITDPTRWSADAALPTPGTLQFQSDPTPIHRRVYTTWFNPQGEVLDCIDVVYTGVLSSRRQPETLLSRFAINLVRDGGGNVTGARLVQIPIGVSDTVGNPPSQTAWTYGVVDEMLARQGNTTTWQSRDIAWLYAANRINNQTGRTQRDLIRGDGRMYFDLVSVDRAGNRTPLLKFDANNPPVLDTATGKVYVNSNLGGRIIIDPQGGTVTFNGITPTNADKVLLSYTPQTLRLNVSRNDTGALAAPGGADGQSGVAWAVDPGFTPRSHIEPSGPDTGPVAFLDTNPYPNAPAGNAYSWNPRYQPNLIDNTVGGVPNNSNVKPPADRLWLFFRKADATAAGPSTIWFKTMRLMVRLPRGVLRDPDGKVLTNLNIAGNRGPYEVDWVRGRVYFTQIDEGNVVSITFNYARQNNGGVIAVPATQYRVAWGDEMSSAVSPGDATTNERVLPVSTPVNEGQVSAFKDPFQDKVWVFWSSTRAGTTDLYYMTLNPQLYPQPGFSNP